MQEADVGLLAGLPKLMVVVALVGGVLLLVIAITPFEEDATNHVSACAVVAPLYW